ncbi:MAG: glycosyltransferase [Bacteroidota bacterium]
MNQTKKIKILIAVPTLECGGLERNVVSICNYVNNGKFETTLVVVNNDNPFYTVTNLSVDVINLKKKRVSSSIPEFLKIIKTKKPDIILTAANHLNLLFAISKWLFPQKIKFIARESSIVSINTKRNKFPKLFDLLLKIFYRKFDQIVCQSEFMRNDLLKHYHIPEANIKVINNAVLLPDHKLTAENTTDHILQYITVARLSEEKGIDRIIRSLILTKKKFHYTIIGDGPLKKTLKELVKKLNMQDQVTFLGPLDLPYKAIYNPDLFLFGSHYEGFPNVLLEANALGIPVVSFNAPGGIGEVIADFKNGILVENANEPAFAAAVDKAVDFPFDRKKIQLDTIEYYSPNKIKMQWESLFISVFSN